MKLKRNLYYIDIYNINIMFDDWENQDYTLPVLQNNLEQQKILDERKLVEESDNKLTKELFGEEDLAFEELKQLQKPPKVVETKTLQQKPLREKPEKKHEKKPLIEQKQKMNSKQLKLQKERERELFGEVEYDDYDKYAEYDEMFH